MASHLNQGIAFIGVSLFVGWLAFQAVFPSPSKSSTDFAPETNDQAGSTNLVAADVAEIATLSPDYEACLDQSGGVTANMLDCIGTEYQRADGLLNAEYRQLMASLPQADKLELRAAQRNWISARDTACENQATEHGDGTLYTVTYAACQVDQTIERVGWLRNYSADDSLDASDGTGNWSTTIETSFGENVGPTAVCEGEYWQLNHKEGKQSLSWMDDNGTPELASDDFYVEYDFQFDGSTITLTNGKITTYRTDNPRDGTRVSDKQFPMQKTSDGILLNGELLQGCRN